ncbi:MAG: anti-anti-sigma factor family protein [Candidatus Acidoferrum typicum]|nr:anti-anti-sigma factor family protein [Candidatus Acidoferrum typicum]
MFGNASDHSIGFLLVQERKNVALKMTNREVDGASVVALDGRIVLGEESQALRVELKNLVAEGKKKIVLNMDNIKYIDSAGLGILVAAHVCAKAEGASLKLSNLGSKFREVLQITKLFTVFDVYNTEAAAIASFLRLTDEAAAEKPSVTLPGTFERIIQSPDPNTPEKTEISVQGADELYQEIRIENTLTDEHGDEVRLKKGALVEVTVEAAVGATESKLAST